MCHGERNDHMKVLSVNCQVFNLSRGSMKVKYLFPSSIIMIPLSMILQFEVFTAYIDIDNIDRADILAKATEKARGSLNFKEGSRYLLLTDQGHAVILAHPGL